MREKQLPVDGIFNEVHPVASSIGTSEFKKRATDHGYGIALPHRMAVERLENGEPCNEEGLEVVVEIEHERLIQTARQEVPNNPEKRIGAGPERIAGP